MTTRIIVKACCDKERTKVEIKVANMHGVIEHECQTIEDGEEHDLCVYDDRVVTVQEVAK